MSQSVAIVTGASRGNRAGPLRHGVPDRLSRRSSPGLARGRYTVVANAGHSAWKPSISAQLVAVIENMKARF